MEEVQVVVGEEEAAEGLGRGLAAGIKVDAELEGI